MYIAGKLNAPSSVGYTKNVAVMIKVYNALLRAGYHPYCPAFDLLAGIVDGGFEYDDYALTNKAWLEVSEAVVVLPDWGGSKGTKAEIKRAKQLKIPVIMLSEYNIKNLTPFLVVEWFEAIERKKK